jgi:hypothetical protein
MWTAAECDGCGDDPTGDPLGRSADPLGDCPQSVPGAGMDQRTGAAEADERPGGTAAVAPGGGSGSNLLQSRNIAAKFDFINKKPNDSIMQTLKLGKADGFARESFDPCA